MVGGREGPGRPSSRRAPICSSDPSEIAGRGAHSWVRAQGWWVHATLTTPEACSVLRTLLYEEYTT